MKQITNFTCFLKIGTDLSSINLRLFSFTHETTMKNNKKIENKISYFNLFIPTIFLSLLFYCCLISYLEQNNYQELQTKMTKISVNFPKEKPEMNQENIDLAMALFSIQKNSNTLHPLLYSEMQLRGLTVGESFSLQREVYIGNMAFDSWGILGSTLAHEIEVHSNQSFLKIELLNYLDNLKIIPKYLFAKAFNHKIEHSNTNLINSGTFSAEKEAYEYEINSQIRFNLTNSEIYQIKYTLEHDLI